MWALSRSEHSGTEGQHGKVVCTILYTVVIPHRDVHTEQRSLGTDTSEVQRWLVEVVDDASEVIRRVYLDFELDRCRIFSQQCMAALTYSRLRMRFCERFTHTRAVFPMMPMRAASTCMLY